MLNQSEPAEFRYPRPTLAPSSPEAQTDPVALADPFHTKLATFAADGVGRRGQRVPTEAHRDETEDLVVAEKPAAAAPPAPKHG